MTLRNSIIFCLVAMLSFSCRRINPERTPLVGETKELPKATSTINISLSIPLSRLENQLNQRLNPLLFSGKGLELGNGLFSDMDITKTGILKLSSAENGNVRVSMPIFLDGNVLLQKKIFGQSVSAAIPFKEALTPQFSFQPRISENWGIQIDQLEIESWGKPLQYDLLGYQIDIEPMVKKHLTSLIKNQLASEGSNNFNLKSLAEKAWKAYGQPILISNDDWEMTLLTSPEILRISQRFTTDQQLELSIGLEGEVISHAGALQNHKAPPLPAVTSANPHTENSLDITLPLIVPYADLDKWLTKELVGSSFRLNSKTQLTPKSFASQAFGNRALVKMGFIAKRDNRKDVEGDLYLVGTPVYSEAENTILFENIDFDLNTENFLTNSARWLKKNQIISAIEKKAVVPIGSYMDQARQELSELGSWQTDFATFDVENPTLAVEGIYTTPTDIRLYLRSKGKVAATMKP